jgi:hypothetical protein
MFKILEEMFQILQACLMILASRRALFQITAQKRRERIVDFKRYGDLVTKYFKFVFFTIVGLVILRTVRAYSLYVIVDTFLQDEYKESYSTWKAMNTNYKDMISLDIKREEKYNVD